MEIYLHLIFQEHAISCIGTETVYLHIWNVACFTVNIRNKLSDTGNIIVRNAFVSALDRSYLKTVILTGKANIAISCAVGKRDRIFDLPALACYLKQKVVFYPD